MKGSSSMASIVSAKGSLWSRKRVSPISTSAKRKPSPLRDAAKRTPAQLLSQQCQQQTAAEAARAALAERELQNLLELEYQSDVKAYMYEMEGQTMPTVELIDQQPELQWYMRPYLIDFLIEIHQQHRLRPETLYLAVNIVDRYVSRRIVFKKHYQLVGCAALWIAAKFEDAKDRVPTVPELCQLCSGAYDESAFVQMEGHVLSTINWALGHPTAEAWLRLACVTNGIEDQRTQHVARFIMELTLFQKEYIPFKPSEVAHASLLLARFLLGKTRRIEDESENVLRIATLLDSQLGERLDALSVLVVRKYSWQFYSRASTLVREWYLSGRRFSYFDWTSSSSPMRRASSSVMTTPSQPTSCALESSPSTSSSSSSATSSDDSGDEFEEPITPNTPSYGAVSPYVPSPEDMAGDGIDTDEASHEDRDYAAADENEHIKCAHPAMPAVRAPLNRASWEMNHARAPHHSHHHLVPTYQS